MAENEIMDLTGLSNVEAKDRPMMEKDILTALLAMEAEKSSLKEALPIEIKRDGKVRLFFRVNPLSDEDIRRARKAATKTKPNPNGRKLPPIEWDRDDVKYRSLLIYNATVPEDRRKIWDNQEFKNKFDLIEGYETVDKVLNIGEKMKVVEKIFDFSGMSDEDADDDEKTEEDYAKN